MQPARIVSLHCTCMLPHTGRLGSYVILWACKVLAKPDMLAMRAQALVDDISAAAYNVIFTSLPILFFAVLDRPLRHHKTMLRFPQARTCGPCDLIAFG